MWFHLRVQKSIAKIFVFSISTAAVSIIFVLPWTTIPRTNSIIYQSSWMEVFLPTLSNLIIGSGTDLLNLSVWTKENTLMNVRIFLKMLTMNMASYFFTNHEEIRRKMLPSAMKHK